MKKFIQKILMFFQVFSGRFGKNVLEHTNQAIKIGEAIKMVIGGQIGNLLENFIEKATGVDIPDSLRAGILTRLDLTLKILYSGQMCAEMPTPEQRIACVLAHLKGLNKDKVPFELLGIASTYLMQIYPELTKTQAISIVQAKILEIKES